MCINTWNAIVYKKSKVSLRKTILSVREEEKVREEGGIYSERSEEYIPGDEIGCGDEINTQRV